MILSKDQFPIVVQAFEMADNKEFFIAEQVVNSQAEVDSFVSRYAGRLIKARPLTSAEGTTSPQTIRRKRSSSTGVVILVIVIILIILIAIGLYTGWIQRTLGISL